MAEKAIDCIDVALMKNALQRTKELGFVLSPALQSAMKTILDLPGDQLRQLRLKRHIQRGDEAGVVAATIDIKSVFFSKVGNSSAIFSLHSYPLLRNSKDFGNRLGIYDPKLEAGMLTYSPTPIHKSLCKLEHLARNDYEAKSLISTSMNVFKMTSE